jgi:hypothetical protein
MPDSGCPAPKMVAGRADSEPPGLDHHFMCDHLCDTTTRYDPAAQILTFMLVCPACGTERVLETRRYAPRFRPTAG